VFLASYFTALFLKATLEAARARLSLISMVHT
jgi:hypothetical protein